MGNIKILNALVKRNLKLFVRDKLTMFFSLLSSLIILMLFVLFLKDVQIDGVNTFLKSFNVSSVDSIYVNSIVNGWFLSGVLAVSIISVGLSFYSIMIRDKELGIINDFSSSPIEKNLIKTSYFISSFIINIIVNIIILTIGIIYLFITKTMFLNIIDILLLLVNIIISSLSASLIMLLISSLFNKESQFGGFTGIMSSIIGFIIGAYMPVSTFPTAIQYIVSIVPGTYSAGIFRNIFISPTLDKISYIGQEPINAISDYFGLEINFFSKNISYEMCYLFLLGSIIIFSILTIVIFKYIHIKKKSK